APVYVLGTEVPVPGGANHALATVAPTDPQAARETLAIHRDAFAQAGLSDAFERVIALVVQPGVESGSDNVLAYEPPRAGGLSAAVADEPDLVCEAHPTDYQTPEALFALGRDGYPILKVGPGLTFAYRHARYGRDLAAAEVVPGYGDRPRAKA